MDSPGTGWLLCRLWKIKCWQENVIQKGLAAVNSKQSVLNVQSQWLVENGQCLLCDFLAWEVGRSSVCWYLLFIPDVIIGARSCLEPSPWTEAFSLQWSREQVIIRGRPLACLLQQVEGSEQEQNCTKLTNYEHFRFKRQEKSSENCIEAFSW